MMHAVSAFFLQIMQFPNSFEALRRKAKVEYDGQSSYKTRDPRDGLSTGDSGRSYRRRASALNGSTRSSVRSSSRRSVSPAELTARRPNQGASSRNKNPVVTTTASRLSVEEPPGNKLSGSSSPVATPAEE